MPHSIYLPSEEECKITVNIGEHSITMDLFDFDVAVADAQELARDQGTSWHYELPSIMEKRFNIALTEGQCLLLWEGTRVRLQELKKKLFEGPQPSKKSGASKQKPKKTSTASKSPNKQSKQKGS